MHTGARLAFVATGVLAGAALSAATLVALTPKPVAAQRADVAIALLPEGEGDYITKVSEPSLIGLDAVARRARGGGQAPPAPLRASTHSGLPIYVVRHDAQVRAFIAIDPRNGCALEPRSVMTSTFGPVLPTFHDVCHGSLYDLTGAHIGGPSPWSLDQLVIRIDGRRVYASTRDVIPGCSYYAPPFSAAAC